MNLLILGAAGIAAGAVNAAVGSGTLLTYPLLLAAGLPPVVANGTNSLGISPGNAAGAFVYRKQLAGRGRVVVGLMLMIGMGAAIGASLVLRLPANVFETLVPWLIIAACVLVVVQPSDRQSWNRCHEFAQVGSLSDPVLRWRLCRLFRRGAGNLAHRCPWNDVQHRSAVVERRQERLAGR